jgi:hypothetical protein
MEEIKPGIYQHYKGNFYLVLGVAHHSENLSKMVVYMGLYDSPEFGKNPIWVRPYELFIDEVKWQGKKVQRFKFIK